MKLVMMKMMMVMVMMVMVMVMEEVSQRWIFEVGALGRFGRAGLAVM